MNSYFTWLKILISDYEDRVGDNKGIDVWNWMMETYKPDDNWEQEIQERKIAEEN